MGIPHIEIANLNQELQFSPNGSTLLVLVHNRLGRNVINSLCGGNGKCGKCRVRISGKLSNSNISEGINKPTMIEQRLLGDSIHDNIRLACQVIPKDKDMKITILELSECQDSIFKIQDSFSDFVLDFQFNPRIISHSLFVPPPSLETAQDDFTRLSIALKTTVPLAGLKPETLSQLALILREKDGKVHAVIDGQKNELIEVKAQKHSILGTVVDVGTTSIVVTLIDLETGIILGADSIINPQIEFGRDIMSRLTYALKSSSNQRRLQEKVFNGISKLLTELTSSTKSSFENIYEMVVVGNSAMHHLFLNLPVIGLSRAPFVPVISKTQSFFAKDIDETQCLNMPSQALITMPPLIGGFIGSDAVVDILYTGFDQKEGVHLLIDFGTNSEIILQKDNNLYAASVAAGGAFEGQHIACGMRGVAGAIEKFLIENGKNKFQTIQSIKPKGICGTGIIDILAQLLLHEQLDHRGQLFTDSGEKIKRLILVPAEQTYNNQEIYLTRNDVEAIQKAKAATEAAIRTLTDHLNIEIENLDSVHIAGVFGSNLNIDSSKVIGLLPNLPNDRFVIQGNTAEKGGRVFLLSMEARNNASTIATAVERLELTQFSKFQSFFTEGLFFPKNIHRT
ncbi:MAG: ASKHA domain-containing protein [Candidatus Hodarchaeota archaeon]